MPSTTTGRERNGLPAFPLNNMQNKSTNQLIGIGILTLFVIVILYEIWPYLIGFLTVVGAAQVYRVWRNHYGR